MSCKLSWLAVHRYGSFAGLDDLGVVCRPETVTEAIADDIGHFMQASCSLSCSVLIVIHPTRHQRDQTHPRLHVKQIAVPRRAFIIGSQPVLHSLDGLIRIVIDAPPSFAP